MIQIELFLWGFVLELVFLIFIFLCGLFYFGVLYRFFCLIAGSRNKYKSWIRLWLFCVAMINEDKDRPFSSSSYFKMLANHVLYYPTPCNFNYLYSFGSLAGLFLGLQIITGFFLVRFYTPHIDLAFSSVEQIRRNVNFGWLLRYMHANGASFFFLLCMLDRLRGLFYKSYAQPRLFVWLIGVVIFFLIRATAFIGYVLPWGQISFWGRTVITNLFSAIPFVGVEVAQWLWGGFAVSNATLNRFFALHFILPIVIAGLAVLHLARLHNVGSSNPVGVDHGRIDRFTFYPYFYVKDLFAFIVVVFIYRYVVFFMPNSLGHADNYIIANPLVTPTHIVPEWYFLLYYRILRVVPQKLGGVILIVGAIFMFVQLAVSGVKLISNCSRIVRSTGVQFFYQLSCYGVVFVICCLTYIGSQSVEQPFIFLGIGFTIFYFFLFGVGLIWVWIFENYLLFYVTKRKF